MPEALGWQGRQIPRCDIIWNRAYDYATWYSDRGQTRQHPYRRTAVDAQPTPWRDMLTSHTADLEIEPWRQGFPFIWSWRKRQLRACKQPVSPSSLQRWLASILTPPHDVVEWSSGGLAVIIDLVWSSLWWVCSWNDYKYGRLASEFVCHVLPPPTADCPIYETAQFPV